MRSVSVVHWSLLLGGLLATVGCGGSGPNRPLTVPVSGTVTYQGQPVVDANIVFRSKQEDLEPAYAKTDAEGQFQLQTFDFNDGARPGEFLVTVSKYSHTIPLINEGEPGYVPPPPPKPLLPKKYSDPRTSGLEATVAEGEENEFTFALQD